MTLNRTCYGIVDCFAKIPCAEAQENKKMYEKICEKLEFEVFDMPKCMLKFYAEKYKPQLVFEDDLFNRPKVSDFDFFSKNLTAKRNAYITGRHALDNHARACGEKPEEYVESRYPRLLDILTVPSENSNCQSLHDNQTAMQCAVEWKMIEIALQTRIAKYIGFTEITERNFTEICQNALSCSKNSCHFLKNETEKLRESCEILTSSKGKLSECISTFHLQLENLLSYNCTNLDNVHRGPFNSYPESAFKFLKDKECMRTLAKGICDKEDMSSFDEVWDELQSMWITTTSGLWKSTTPSVKLITATLPTTLKSNHKL